MISLSSLTMTTRICCAIFYYPILCTIQTNAHLLLYRALYHTLQEHYFMNIMEIFLSFFLPFVFYRLRHPQKYEVYTIKGSKQKYFSMFLGEIIPDHYPRSSRYKRCNRFGRSLWSDFNSKSRYKKGSAKIWAEQKKVRFDAGKLTFNRNSNCYVRL